MATAGRILIIPKGRYNEETQYSMLDMVSYGGKGWICKKTCIGIAPEEGEYWAECIDVSEGFNGVNFKIDEVEAMVTEEIATRENDIAELNDKVDVATNISKGRNQAHVFNTTAEMQAWISDSANKGLWSKGDNIYIVELNVPDWWVAEVLEEADAETGYYYKIAQLETQKVDLTTIQTQLNNKLDKGGHAVNKAVVTDGNGNIAPTGITSTEIATLSGVSGNIQTQLNERVKKTIVIAQGVDLNTITESGFYRLNASHVNLPSDGAGTHSTMIVSRGNDTLFQIIVTFETAQMYVRSAYGVGGSVTWSGWKKYLSASNFHVSGTTLNITTS